MRISYAAPLTVSLALAFFAFAASAYPEATAATIPAAQSVAEPAAPEQKPAVSAASPIPAPAPASAAPAVQKKIPTSVTLVGDPARLVAPAIKLSAPIVRVGIDAKGLMDVPPGSTNNVGWYAAGVKPGEEGSAVLDAHVYAAFKNLHNVSVGDDLYVEGADGSRLHFRVERVATYALADLTPDMLFNRKGGKYLHLITCAGQWSKQKQDYTHRLVVYAELVR